MAQSHHYLPKFYLSEFVDPTSPKGHEPYAWVFSFKTSAWEKKSPKNICRESGFYSFTDEQGQNVNDLEKILSQFEGATASILKKKIKQERILSQREKYYVSGFVTFMLTRTPGFRNMLDGFTTKIVNSMKTAYKARPEAFEKFKKEFEKQSGEKLPADFDSYYFADTKVKLSQAFQLYQMVSHFEEVAMIIADMKWTFIYTDENSPFITCDWPYNMCDPNARPNWIGHGLANRNIEVTLPLTKDICLLATWDKARPDHGRANLKNVENANKIRLSVARDFIIASTKEFPGKDYLDTILEKRRKKH